MATRARASAIAPTHQQIAELAHQLYVAEGCPQGRAEQHWRQAEAQLNANPTSTKARPSSRAKAKPKTTQTKRPSPKTRKSR